MREDIYKDGVKFSSTHQPPNENKRVPKWKTRLKKLLLENYEEISKVIIEKSKEGSIKHIEFLRDWLYGKVPQQIKGDLNINENRLIIENNEKTKEELKDTGIVEVNE